MPGRQGSFARGLEPGTVPLPHMTSYVLALLVQRVYCQLSIVVLPMGSEEALRSRYSAGGALYKCGDRNMMRQSRDNGLR